jgi:hypothetical protein
MPQSRRWPRLRVPRPAELGRTRLGEPASPPLPNAGDIPTSAFWESARAVCLLSQRHATKSGPDAWNVGSAGGFRDCTAWPTGRGCLPPPHRTVRAVLPHTALRHRSPAGIRKRWFHRPGQAIDAELVNYFLRKNTSAEARNVKNRSESADKAVRPYSGATRSSVPAGLFPGEVI